VFSFITTITFAAVLFLSSTAYARSTAIIFGYDCNPKAIFGASSENQIAVLEALGWEIQYYCGNDKQEAYQNCTVRRDSLTSQNLICALEEMDIKNGDRILFILNTHGELESKIETAKITDGWTLDQEMPDPQKQGLVVFQENSSAREMKIFPVDHYMRLISDIEAKNSDGVNIIFNNSCFGGSCFRFVPENSKTCVVSSAPADEVAQINNFFFIMFQNLPNSPALFFTEEDKSTYHNRPNSNFRDESRQSAVIYNQLNKRLKKVQKKIEFSSSLMKEVLAQSLWHDYSGTNAVYTHGFGIDALNVSGDIEFIEKYALWSASLPEHQQKSAIHLLEKFKKVVFELQAKTEPVAILGGLVRDKNPFDREKGQLRNQMMSIAITASSSSCSNFDFNQNFTQN
jgi:hypothetical protein